MARITFTQNCKVAASGRKPPYIAVPPLDTDVGDRVRTKDGTILGHILPPEIVGAFVSPTKATHVFYAYDGRDNVRELGDKVYRLTEGEAAFLRMKYPGITNELPDEEIDEAVAGRLLDERARAEREAERANKQATVSAQKLTESSVKLTQAEQEVANFKKENKRLQAIIDKAEATPKPAKAAKPKDDPKK